MTSNKKPKETKAARDKHAEEVARCLSRARQFAVNSLRADATKEGVVFDCWFGFLNRKDDPELYRAVVRKELRRLARILEARAAK